MPDRLRVEWTTISDATVVSLIGTVDTAALPAVREVAQTARTYPRLLIDLSMVSAVDTYGIAILEALSELRNVAILNVSPAIQDVLGPLGLVP